MENTNADLFEKVTVPDMTPEDKKKFLKNQKKQLEEAFAPTPEDSDKQPSDDETTS